MDSKSKIDTRAHMSTIDKATFYKLDTNPQPGSSKGIQAIDTDDFAKIRRMAFTKKPNGEFEVCDSQDPDISNTSVTIDEIIELGVKGALKVRGVKKKKKRHSYTQKKVLYA